MQKQWLAIATLPPSEHFGLKQLMVEGTGPAEARILLNDPHPHPGEQKSFTEFLKSMASPR